MKGYRKYGNTKCSADGHKFDSKKEMARYFTLKALQAQGKISGLKVHPKYFLKLGDGKEIVIRGDKRLSKTGRSTRVTFELDFEYFAHDLSKEVFEDVKSIPTAKKYDFKIKRAIFEAMLGVEVTVIL